MLVTEWNEYRKPDFDSMLKLMKENVILDGRNIFDRQQLLEIGFEYYGIGRQVDVNKRIVIKGSANIINSSL